MTSLALFRGALRHEYRMQIVKYLRAIDGEVTRTDYRERWLAPGVLDSLAIEKHPLCYIILMDPDGSLALPLRQAILLQHEFENGILRVQLSLGEFLRPCPTLPTTVSLWAQHSRMCPPTRYLSVWQEEWPVPEPILDPVETLGRWRDGVDFATRYWDFSNTVFLRINAPGITAVEGGLELPLVEAQESVVGIQSYNPHLDPESAAERSVFVHSRGDVDIIGENRLSVDRDGQMKVQICPMSVGDMEVFIGVEPDHQFSTFFPLTIVARPNAEGGRRSIRRLLGREWQYALRDVARLVEDIELRLRIFEQLSRAVPDDPDLYVQQGQILLELSRNDDAYLCAMQALHFDPSSRDAHILALVAAMRRANIADVLELLPKMDFSSLESVNKLDSELRRGEEEVVAAVVRIAPQLVGDHKLLKLLRAAQFCVRSEGVALILVEPWFHLDTNAALHFLLDQVTRHQAWADARTRLVEYAHEAGHFSVVHSFGTQALRHLLQMTGTEAFYEAFNRWGRRLDIQARQDVLLEAACYLLGQRPGDATNRDTATIFLIEAAQLAKSQNDLTTVLEAHALLRANGVSNSTVTSILKELRDILEEEEAKTRRPEWNPLEPGMSVADAVALARAECSKNLVFLDDALKSANESPFNDAGVVYTRLRLLDEVACEYHAQTLEGDLDGAFRLRGLRYKPFISDTSKQLFRTEYERRYDGQTIQLGPHIDLGRKARIYFYIDKERKCFVVGHVGRHLPTAHDR